MTESSSRPSSATDLLMRWSPAAVWGSTIFWFSSQSSPPGSSLAPAWAGHLAFFAILASALVWGATDRLRGRLTRTAAALTVAASTLYGVIDEFHQSFVPGRDPSGWDVAADFAGALTAAIVWWMLLRARDARS